jgi:hypothetical protein
LGEVAKSSCCFLGHFIIMKKLVLYFRNTKLDTKKKINRFSQYIIKFNKEASRSLGQ